MRPFSLLFIFTFLITICSCRSDFSTVPSSGKLAFSRDTVFLDTVFSTISSSTYLLKVYNHSKNDINIPTIQFSKGLNSKYRMTVDGMQGENNKIFNNVVLLAKDSLYVFIETTPNIADANPDDFLYEDTIEFDSGNNLQKVTLLTLVKDAIFLYPKRLNNNKTETVTFDNTELNGFYLDENDPVNGNELHFTNQKSYVIYGYATVPEGKKVIFDAGSRVYFHANSGLIIPQSASLECNGSISTTSKQENEVIFEGDRQEADYANIPGQWATIWLRDGSTNHNINHLTIKNATIGLKIDGHDQSTCTIKNSQIYNSSNYGILAQNAKIAGENIVINSAGKAALACTYGGNYLFTHCTFNNYWNGVSQTTLSISNYKTAANPEIMALTQATFNNCIIYGAYSNELNLDKNASALFEYQFNNCLLKDETNSSNPLYNFDDNTHYKNIITNQNPHFLDIAKNKLNINNTSAAFAKGNPAYLIPLDINGKTRTLPPDLGAYQSMPFPE
ncbi:hypothetical protein SAMN05192550_1961 [Flavobacterium glycines]|uniref:Right handed beta helix domain-containing protein n=1 Tax=Flavobacterium glycines TaxID=551990 RepID=A0A1B9DGF1_9FLAO|nr:hypothetical protein [Flavobacterium glycines]OCB68786.1 hypothetical protein FBGL_14440 [Flavobacterium glycines]SDJ34632.1 hypothetical protein SAMN05192550_1961 [Flavobacterium glycines]